MEECQESLLNFVPNNLRGVDVLVVHDDKVSLTYLSSLLEKYSFKVTASDVAAEAESIICNEGGKFKLVMANANMPCMDILSFLDLLLQRNIPLVCTYYGYEEAAKEALFFGAVFILEEPIRLQDLKYVWQQMHHTTENPENANPSTSCIDKVDEASAGKRIHDDNIGNPNGNIAQLTSDQMKNSNVKHIARDKGEERREHNSNGSAPGVKTTKRQKRSVVWKPELREKFTDALGRSENNVLSSDKSAEAKEILEEMNVPSLTVHQVASHIQRHKYQLKREHNANVPALTIPSNFKGKTEFPTSLGNSRSGTTGGTAPAASLNENHNQNQVTTDAVNPFQCQETQNNAGPDAANPLQCQETQHNAVSRHGLSTRIANHGSRNVDAIGGNRLPTASRSQSQTLLRPLDSKKLSSIQYALSRSSNYASRNRDTVVGKHVPNALRNQNQSLLKLQYNSRNSILQNEPSTGSANYGRPNMDASTQNHMSAASGNQNKSIFQRQKSQENATFPHETPTGLANSGSRDSVVQNNAPTALGKQKRISLSLQQNQDNATVAYGLQTGLMNCGSQNLDAFAGNHVLDISTNQNRSFLQMQESTGNANNENEVQPGLFQYGSQNIGTVVGNQVPTALVDHNQCLNQLEGDQGNANFSHELSSGFADFGSQSSDVVAQNRVQADLVNQNQSIQLQMSIGDAPFGVLAGLPNHEGPNIDGLIRNLVSDASVSQNQSLVEQQVTSGNAAIIHEPLTGVANYGYQNVDSATASVDQNQSLHQCQQNLGNATFPYEFPTQLDNSGNQPDAVAQNLVPDASMNYNNQSLQLQGTQDTANFQYELPMGLANYESQNMDVVQNSVPADSVNQNNYPFQLQGTQDNANFRDELPMGLANYEIQNMDVLQKSVPADSVNQNNYPSQLQTAQRYGTCPSDLPTGLANYGSQNLDILAQESVPAASMIPNEYQGRANFLSKVPAGRANHGSQNTEAGLQNHVSTGLHNSRNQNLDSDMNNPVTTASTVQNQLQDTVYLDWARRFLLEEN